MLHNPIMRRLLAIALVLLFGADLSLAQGNTNEDKLREAKRLSDRTLILYNDGQYKQALPLLEKALQLRTEALGEKHPDTLTSLNNLAEAYVAIGRPAEALALHEKALWLRTEILGEKHPITLVSLDNLAKVYDALGRHVEALPLNVKALRFRTETLGEKHPDTLSSLNNLANTYYYLGRPAEALALHEKTLRLYIGTLGEKHPLAIGNLDGLAATYVALGRPAEALPLLEKGLRLRTETLGEKHPDTIRSLHNLAAAYHALGRTAEALPLLEKVLRLRAETLGEKHPDALRNLSDLALVYTTLGRPAKALPLNEKALRLLTETLGEKHPYTLESLNSLADTYAALGRYANALALHEKALRIRTETLGEKHPDTFVSLIRLAQAYAGLGPPAKSLPLLEQFVNGVEQLRASGDLSAANRQGLFVQWVGIYKWYAQLLVEQGNATRGFELAELSKARTLLESSALRRANEAGMLNPAERDQVRNFEVRLSLLDEKIAAAFNQPETKLNLETNKNQLHREYADLRRQLAAKYPKYAQLSDVKILTAEEGKALLSEDTVLLSYLVVEDYSLAFILSAKEGLRAYVLGKIPGLDKSIEAYRQLISDPMGAKGLAQDGFAVTKLPDRTFVVMATGKTKPVSPVQDATEIGRDLAEKLLKPILPAIAGYRQWIISPDSALAMLPFETLPVDGQPVIASHDVSYVQSLSMYALLKEREEQYRNLQGRKALFAMGGAIYDSTQAAADRGRRINCTRKPATVDVSAMLAKSQDDASSVERAFEILGLKWSNLPGTEAEVSNVAEVFADSDPTVLGKLTRLINKVEPSIVSNVTDFLGIEITPYSAVYKGEHATEGKLQELNRQGALTKYRYLLFSAHGYLSTHEPSLSALVLGQANKAPGTDGYVTASEWPAYDLKSDLIVLSACDTGVGKLVQGEGVTGLSYALYVAGNKNTVLSLWPVVDESTSLFMTRFFERLKSGLPQAQALGETKREFLKHPQFNKPAFWAPFVMYGS